MKVKTHEPCSSLKAVKVSFRRSSSASVQMRYFQYFHAHSTAGRWGSRSTCISPFRPSVWMRAPWVLTDLRYWRFSRCTISETDDTIEATAQKWIRSMWLTIGAKAGAEMLPFPQGAGAYKALSLPIREIQNSSRWVKGLCFMNTILWKMPACCFLPGQHFCDETVSYMISCMLEKRLPWKTQHALHRLLQVASLDVLRYLEELVKD